MRDGRAATPAWTGVGEAGSANANPHLLVGTQMELCKHPDYRPLSFAPALTAACPSLQVTNTPWGERVSFVFRPQGEAVQKALHVSPFMDMKNTW